MALVAGTAQAQVHATLTLTSGKTVTGQLVDLGGVGYTVQVNGQERHIPQSDVAVIDFTGGNVDWTKFNGTSMVVLRNGETMNGTLEDIGGKNPLRLTVNTAAGARDSNRPTSPASSWRSRATSAPRSGTRRARRFPAASTLTIERQSELDGDRDYGAERVIC